MKKYFEIIELIELIFVSIVALIMAIGLYKLDAKQKKFIGKIQPLIEQRDTTHSLRNYEVLTDSIKNEFVKYWCDDTSE